MSYAEDRQEEYFSRHCSEALGDGFNLIFSNYESVIFETTDSITKEIDGNPVDGKIIVAISDVGTVRKPEYSAEIVFTPKPDTLSEELINNIKWQFGYSPNDNFEVNQLGVYEYGLLNKILSKVVVQRKKDLSVIPSLIKNMKGEYNAKLELYHI